MERTVQCVAADGQESNRCSQDDMPEARKVCRNPSCEYYKKSAARLPGLRTGQVKASISYGLTRSGHLRDLAWSEIFMIRGKHQRFTVQCIYFPMVGWDFKEWVAFGFLWFNAAICHTWLNSWNFCVHACTCVCIQPERLSWVKSLHNTLLLWYATVYLLIL